MKYQIEAEAEPADRKQLPKALKKKTYISTVFLFLFRRLLYFHFLLLLLLPLDFFDGRLAPHFLFLHFSLNKHSVSLARSSRWWHQTILSRRHRLQSRLCHPISWKENNTQPCCTTTTHPKLHQLRFLDSYPYDLARKVILGSVCVHNTQTCYIHTHTNTLVVRTQRNESVRYTGYIR